MLACYYISPGWCKKGKVHMKFNHSYELTIFHLSHITKADTVKQGIEVLLFESTCILRCIIIKQGYTM